MDEFYFHKIEIQIDGLLQSLEDLKSHLSPDHIGIDIIDKVILESLRDFEFTNQVTYQLHRHEEVEFYRIFFKDAEWFLEDAVEEDMDLVVEWLNKFHKGNEGGDYELIISPQPDNQIKLTLEEMYNENSPLRI